MSTIPVHSSPILRIAGAALALAALASCSDWNEKKSEFASYAEFAASPLAGNGLLPSNLVPRSARKIRIVANIDTTEVEAEFDFDASDEELLRAPFLSPGMIVYGQLAKQGQVPAPVPADSEVLVRCGEGAVEFLQVAKHVHARYWTSRDKQLRTSACPRTLVGSTSA